ncbi:hypothetical protein GUJ93_ZPchr0010g9200 [Zizania palustris]|uniref:DUF7597 domain-containing protein n=1 Tax=Zizania palustris TaxID=103762 RepID=A0A8J5WD85_ZIZPA|nr:hypothetical protein GUJ93_ZPchr0010g9200 [Zizania palustris]
MLFDGGGEMRKRRNVVSLSGQQVKKNEDLAIALCDDHMDAMECQEFLQLIQHHITQVLRLHVIRHFIYPIGVGIFKLGSIFTHDCLVSSGPHWIDQVTVAKLSAGVLDGNLLVTVPDDVNHANDNN